MYLFVQMQFTHATNVNACISYDAAETPLLNVQWQVSSVICTA